jgi:transforming growth factor-beta-induced protein
MNYKQNTVHMNRRFNSYVLMLSAVVGSIALSSCDDDDDNGPSQNVVELAQGNDNLSTLEAALVKFPDLVTTLSGSGEVTVFAPTNTAFENLLDAIGQSSLDNIPDDVLRDILEYHVVSGATLSNQLSNGDVTTVGGEEITVSTSGGVTLNGSASVITADVLGTNGVVHIIDEVLVPPTIRPIVGTIVAPAYFNKNFTTLIAAVKAASPAILTTLLSSENKTLFAPTNDAFTAAGITTLPDQATLDAVLSYHVINSEVTSSQITTGASNAETLNGTIYLSKGGTGVFINGSSKVTTADIDASNGVVHVIDRTLMPPSETIAQIATRLSMANPAQFTQLVAALARTQGQGENDLLEASGSSGSNLTVFAPTDAAFQALYTALEVNNVEEIPLATLIAVLKHHIVAGRVFSSDLSSGSVETLNGNVTINLTANPPTVTGSSGSGNEANLQTSMLNIHATNGVIHVIDKVLLPEE